MKRKIFLVLLFLSSLFLRLHDYTLYPQRGATSDEYTYAFLGTSLLTQGMPISWSAFQAYEQRQDLMLDGIHFPLVWPYFDHPPLYGIVVGGFSMLFGQDEFREISLQTIRIMPMILATLTTLLVFLIAKKLYGFRVAFFSLLIYTTTTIFVMNQRVSVSENLLTVLFLGSLYLLIQKGKRLSTKHIIFLGVFAGLAFLTKMMGIAVFVFLFILLLGSGVRYKYTSIFVVVFAGFCGILFLYAWYFDWHLFWQIQAMQSGRNIGPEALFMLTMQPVIVNKVYYDGWYFLGLLALVFLSFDYKKHAFIIIPAVIYFFLLLTSLTREGQSGWYMIPMFPFMAIATAEFVAETLKQKSLTFFLLPLFICLYLIQYLFEPSFGLSPVVYRALLGLTFLPILAAFVYEKGKFFNRVGTLMFYLFILGNIVLTYNYIHPS